MNAIRALINSFRYASNGMTWALKTQRNMRVHFLIAFFAMGLCLVFDITRIEIVLIFFSIVGVMCAELFNSAIEAVVDLVTEEYKIHAKIAKDVAAAAVLLSAVHAVIVGIFVFVQNLYPLQFRPLRKPPLFFPFLLFVGIGIVMLLYFAFKAYLDRSKS